MAKAGAIKPLSVVPGDFDRLIQGYRLVRGPTIYLQLGKEGPFLPATTRLRNRGGGEGLDTHYQSFQAISTALYRDIALYRDTTLYRDTALYRETKVTERGGGGAVQH